MGLRALYRALTPEQRRVIVAKTVSVNRPLDKVMELIAPIAAMDVAGEKARTRFGCAAAVALALIVVAGILAANDAFSYEVGFGLIIFLGFCVAALMYGYGWANGLDVSNNLRMTAMPVLNVLREDVHRTKRVNLKLDLRPPNAKAKLQSRSKRPPSGPYYKIVESIYLDPWISAEVPLADGSILRWRIIDHIRELKKTKRNPRGKIKWKTKYKTRSKIEVELAVRKERYDIPGRDVHQSAHRNTVVIKGRHKTDFLGASGPAPLLDLITQAYRRATPHKGAAS